MASNDEIIIGASLDIDKVVGLEDSLKAVEGALKNNPVFRKELEVTGSQAVLTNLRQVADEFGKVKSMIASVKIGESNFDFELKPEKIQVYSKSVKELIKDYKEEISTVNLSAMADEAKIKKIEKLSLSLKDLKKNKENSKVYKSQESEQVETGNFNVKSYKQMSDFNALLSQVTSKYKEVEKAQKDVNKAVSSGKKEQEESYKSIRNDKLEEALALERKYAQSVKESAKAQEDINRAKSGYSTERGNEEYTRQQVAVKSLSQDLRELSKLKTEQARVSIDSKETSYNENYNIILRDQIRLLESQINSKRQLAGVTKESLDIQLQEIERSSQRAASQSMDKKREQENVDVTRRVNEIKAKYIKLLEQETEISNQINSGRAAYKGVGKEDVLKDIENDKKALDLEAEKIDTEYEHINVTKQLEKAVSDYDKEQVRSGDLNKKNASLMANFADGIKDAIARVANYTIAYRTMWMAIQGFKSSVKMVEELNKTMTDIQMVTGQTAKETAALTSQYSQMGQELGATTKDIAEAANEYIRQGKSMSDTNMLITESLHLAKIGGMETAEATKYLTSEQHRYILIGNFGMFDL